MINVISFVASRPGLRRLVIGRNDIILLFCVAGAVLTTSCSKTKIEPLSTNQSGRDYALGKQILFGESGDSERFKVSGWNSTEKEITWTEGPLAVLQLTGIDATGSLRIKMTLAALVKPPELASQSVEVFANGQKVADWQVTGKSEFVALIPPGGSQGNTLTIELRIPKAASPKSLGLSEDPRVLGLSCFDLTISKTG